MGHTTPAKKTRTHLAGEPKRASAQGRAAHMCMFSEPAPTG